MDQELLPLESPTGQLLVICVLNMELPLVFFQPMKTVLAIYVEQVRFLDIVILFSIPIAEGIIVSFLMKFCITQVVFKNFLSIIFFENIYTTFRHFLGIALLSYPTQIFNLV